MIDPDAPDDPDDGPIVAVPQIAVDDLAVGSNLGRLRDRVAALPDRVDVAVFPEYALTGFVDDDRLREAALEREAALDRLADVADEGNVALTAGYAERAGDALFNATAYVPPAGTLSGGAGAPDERAAVYRKRHLWGEEAERVDAGTDRVVVDTPAGRTGLLTCYDLNFVAESAWFTDRAVDALFVAGAWPAAHAQNWRLLLRARALDGVRWVVGAGRTGRGTASGGERGNDRRRYAGNSLVARPDGRVAAELGRGERDLIATLDRTVLAEQRELVGAVNNTEK
ncbi:MULTISPECIES: carbon-nitrogen hydrolase family protein [unclassified Halorubrum]|uniref:carbon-nitrogen hydrolase family protein n=1 Tax=unclassified Halorubrum TaxID=2642239 RepID=UPI0020CF499F|nr:MULTISPECIES: carbon-nitrogen hydrolase family protein [unclassified Halorubrum]